MDEINIPEFMNDKNVSIDKDRFLNNSKYGQSEKPEISIEKKKKNDMIKLIQIGLLSASILISSIAISVNIEKSKVDKAQDYMAQHTISYLEDTNNNYYITEDGIKLEETDLKKLEALIHEFYQDKFELEDIIYSKNFDEDSLTKIVQLYGYESLDNFYDKYEVSTFGLRGKKAFNEIVKNKFLNKVENLQEEIREERGLGI